MLLLVRAGLREKLHLQPTNRSEGRAIGDPMLGVFECFVGGEGLQGDPLDHEAGIRRNGVLHRPMHLGLGSTPIDQAEHGGDCSGLMRLSELGNQLVRGAWRGLPRPRGPQQSTQEPAEHDPRDYEPFRLSGTAHGITVYTEHDRCQKLVKFLRCTKTQRTSPGRP